MDSLEANFPHLFPKTPTLQDAAAVSKMPGDRGFANDEVLTPGNVVQCDQMFLDGLLLQQGVLKTTVLDNLGAFGLKDKAVLEHDTEPVVLEFFDRLKKLKLEVKRLQSHPELFSDDRTRHEFFKQSTKIAKSTEEILKGDFDIMVELKRLLENPEDGNVPVARREPWATWCGPLAMADHDRPQSLKDFQHNNPDMLLVGTQIIPHMGVLIAEHWRAGVEEIVTAIATTHGKPWILQDFPVLQKMLSDTRFGSKQAVLKFRINQPTAAQSGHIFAFGPQEKVAEMSRVMAGYRCNRDITTVGFLTAIMMGVFMNREDVKKMLPEYHRPI